MERKVAKRVNGGRDEPTLYEVPVNSTVQSVNINGYTASDSEYELNYALSNVYEYATLGPNKMVIIIIVAITTALHVNTSDDEIR